MRRHLSFLRSIASQRRLTLLVAVGFLALAPLAFGMKSGDDRKKPKRSKWKETHAGTIPDEFGDLVSASALQNNKTLLVFRNTAGELRFVEAAQELKKSCKLIHRCETKLKKGAKVPNSYGWTELYAGSIPDSFGKLVNVSTNGTRRVLTFKNEDAQIRIVEFTGVLPDTCVRIDRQYHETQR